MSRHLRIAAAVAVVVVVVGLALYAQSTGALATARTSALTQSTGARGGVSIVGSNPDGSPVYGRPK